MNRCTGLLLVPLVILSHFGEAGKAPAPADLTPSAETLDSATPIGSGMIETLSGTEDLEILFTLIKAANLSESFNNADHITLFAPTDAAFMSLPDGTIRALLKPRNRDALVALLLYHIAPQEEYAESFQLGSLKSIEGSAVTINVAENDISINGAQFIDAGIETTNGLIQKIDEVLLPPDFSF
ncbi:fasciclin domain-containing protein [Puniceicoccus vermicola]|uniref:Fasciclin domain-containing protein n=1 Tax=Puniceicoccus vermicola TaxID=388746 RepID=A0A7X1E605_9BACT|nr:fasciclin domain-containing protein [Puniceicoccus vermicola]MBC2604190.1 fasciclin domain-containing protein [Puniceicoccus vermicola]